MRTNTVFVMAYLGRGAALWVAARAVVTAVLFVGRADPFTLSAGATVAMILTTVAAGLFDTYRSGERTLLANLAVSPSLLCALFAAPAIVGEGAIRLAAAVLS
jgi:hypothetical protein